MELEQGGRTLSRAEELMFKNDTHGASELILSCGCCKAGCSEKIQNYAMIVQQYDRNDVPLDCKWCAKPTTVVLCRPFLFAEDLGPFDDGEN